MLTSLFKRFQQLTLCVCVSFILYFLWIFSTANLKVDVSLPVSRTVAERIVFYSALTIALYLLFLSRIHLFGFLLCFMIISFNM